MKRLIAGATLIACMFTGAAFAKDHDRDHDRGKWEHERHERVEARRDHDRFERERFERERRERERRAHFREARWDRDHDRDRRPPGWDKGKKKGWGDCDVPPGQAKKQGCYDHRRRYRHHRTVTQRPTTTGVWRQHPTTSTTTTTTRSTNIGTWRRPTTTQQTTTTTTTNPPTQAPTQGTWRK